MGRRGIAGAQALTTHTVAASGGFVLDLRIERDSFQVTVLELCELRLMDDVRYPWLILVPRRACIVELFDLDDVDLQLLTTEISSVAQFLKELTQCDKINIAMIGNVVSQLHVHVVGRSADDGNWPCSPWDGSELKRHSDEQGLRRAEEIGASVARSLKMSAN